LGEPTRKDLRYMRHAIEGAELFSTCSKAKHMALLVDRRGVVVGQGYNGGPSGMEHCIDGGCPRALNNTPSGSGYGDCIAIHAEANALLHSDYSARRDGCTLYITGSPCFDCAKLIANACVKRVVYVEKTPPRGDRDQALRFLELCGIELVVFD
jgi:dCMP deaminase